MNRQIQRQIDVKIYRMGGTRRSCGLERLLLGPEVRSLNPTWPTCLGHAKFLPIKMHNISSVLGNGLNFEEQLGRARSQQKEREDTLTPVSLTSCRGDRTARSEEVYPIKQMCTTVMRMIKRKRKGRKYRKQINKYVRKKHNPGWVEVKAILTIAYSNNNQMKYSQCPKSKLVLLSDVRLMSRSQTRPKSGQRQKLSVRNPTLCQPTLFQI